MSSESGGHWATLWKPKPLRQSGATPEDCVALLRELGPKASKSTFLTFRGLAETEPLERLDRAIRFVLGVIKQAPEARDVLSQALSIEEYQSHAEVAKLDISQEAKHTAAQLLCIHERHATLHFFRGAYKSAAQQKPIHPFDILEEK
jgi:hypothetical protein